MRMDGADDQVKEGLYQPEMKKIRYRADIGAVQKIRGRRK